MFCDFTPSYPVADIADEEVHLWLIDTNDVLPSKVLDDGLSLLSDGEKNRMKQFRKAARQHQFLIARVALRCILNALLNHPGARDLRFSTNPYGKPALANNSENIQFNLSHSGSIILIAVTLGRECGVDIEHIDNTRNIYDLARFYFHPAEYGTLRGSHNVPADILQFYKLWTLKEAFIKGEGKGMAIPGNGFYFCNTEAANPRLRVADPALAAHPHWLFHHQVYNDAFSSALAIASPPDTVLNISRRRLLFNPLT